MPERRAIDVPPISSESKSPPRPTPLERHHAPRAFLADSKEGTDVSLLSGASK
jgi:hypothetical protein